MRIFGSAWILNGIVNCLSRYGLKVTHLGGWRNRAMKKVLVTGGCGYLGARLSQQLAEDGYKVTVFDSFDPSPYYRWVSLMENIIVGDIRDDDVVAGLAEKDYDIVIHLISLDHFKSDDDPNRVSSINVMPTWNLLDKFAGKGLEKFIYFSTIHVYGKVPDVVITEEHPLAPKNAYGLTHLLSENICNYFNDKTETCCINVRLSNSYGSPVFTENNCWWLVINDLCKTVFEQNRIRLLSDGSPQRDFIHSSDICTAVEALIETKADCLQKNIFHVASGETLTILELAHAVKDVYRDKFGKEASVLLPDDIVSDSPDAFQDNKRYCFSASRMESLGFRAKTDLREGIGLILQYLAGDPAVDR